MTTTPTTTEAVEQLAIDAIVPDPANRKVSLDAQFVASIRTHGVIQPLLVIPHPDGDGRFHLVAGHRRLAAARKVGFEAVPAIIRELNQQEALEQALVDNLQRQDLSTLERSGIASDASFDTPERPDQGCLAVRCPVGDGTPRTALTWVSTSWVADDATMSE